ncbi:MAG: PD-(D/E)XK nuclease family protein [Ghiorsea sp.]|nr:PD-(D/E)XK nuclease family protein [Ghiorsea sp.]
MEGLGKYRALLQEATPKVRAFQVKKQAKRNMGHDFNIFSIMGMEKSEVKTHSAMIAELLKPNGSHGQGDIFLKCFFACIKTSKIFNSQRYTRIGEYDMASICNNITVKVEEAHRGGKDRIDIVLESDDLLIYIENKIDAKDQKKQLQRYAEIAKHSGKPYCLLYLTKTGHDASLKSIGNNSLEYDKISYKEDILLWLDLCLREEKVIHRTSLQKAILQYLDTVKKITGVNMTDKFNEDMMNLILEEGNLECVETISKFLPKVKGKMLLDFFQEVKDRVGGSIDEKAASKEMQELMVSENKCTAWFNHNNSKQRSKHFGVFFDIGVKDKLFYIMVASRALYYGVVNVKEKPISEGGVAVESLVWKGSHKWYLHRYESPNLEKDSWDLLVNPREFITLQKSDVFFKQLKNTIAKLRSENSGGSNTTP